MRRLLILLPLLSAAFVGMSQARFDAAVMAGATFNQIDGDDAGGYSHLGFRAGVGTSFALCKRTDSPWRMVVEIAWVQKGSSISNDAFERKATLNYVELPLMLSLNLFDYRLRVAAGVAPAVLTSARVEENGMRVGVHERNYCALDWLPLTVAVRYRVSGRWTIEARYQNSLVSVCEESGAGTYRLWQSNKGVFSRCVGVGLSYNIFSL